MENNEDFEWKMFKALGHPIRLKIVKKLIELQEQGICACELMNNIEFSQSNLSQHLKVLKEAGILTSKKVGLNVIYTINKNKIIQIIKLSESISDDIFST